MPETTPDVAGPGATPPARSTDAPDPGARPHHRVVGDDALRTATGRARADWYALLDAAGAVDRRHRDIAAWLEREHGVDVWWAQGITVGYEQERGLRAPGQRQDGTWECSVSRTLAADADRAWALVADATLRDRWLGTDVDVTGRTTGASVRWSLPDGTRAVVRVERVRQDATRVVVQHSRLPDADALAGSKAVWKDRLAALSGLADDPGGR